MQTTVEDGRPQRQMRALLESERRRNVVRSEVAAEVVSGVLNLPADSPVVVGFADSLVVWLKDVREDGHHNTSSKRYTTETRVLAENVERLLDRAAVARGRGSEIKEIDLKEIK